jgi:prolycopene isomerase
MQNSYDVVIIGGGVSGLTLGAILAKAGQKCCIVEKEPHPGGYLAGFERKGFLFDTAIHWLNQFNEEGIAHRCFSFIDKNYPKLKQLNHIQRYQTDNFNILLQTDLEKVKTEFHQAFPEEKKGIEKFFNHVNQLSKASKKISFFTRSAQTMSITDKALFYTRALPAILPMIKHIRYAGDKGVTKGLSKYFKGNSIKDIFSSESDLLSCLFPLAWAKNKDYYIPPSGGSIEIINWLMEQNQQFGNDVLLGTKASTILTEKRKAVGIEVFQKEKSFKLNSNYVVIASDLISAYRNLLPKGFISEKQIQKLENSKQYKSAFTVAVALDCPAEDLGFGEELILLFKNNIERSLHEDSNPDHSKLSVLSPSVRDKSVCPKGKGMVSIYMAADIDKYDFWKTELDSNGKRHRGKEYKDFKNTIAKRLFERVDKEINPEFSKHIIFFEVATPYTYYRYTDNYNGTIMGPRPGKENMQNKVASYFTGVENMLVGGQWAELGGGIPTTSRAALNTALIILKKENKRYFKQLSNYVDGKISLTKLKKLL